MPTNIPNHGNPEEKVFGLIGDFISTDEGNAYKKKSANTLNIGWERSDMMSYPTPYPTSTPFLTPTQTPFPYVSPTPTPTVPPPTATPAAQPTPTPTATPAPTPTLPVVQPTPTPTATTITPTPGPGPTPTPTPTPTATAPVVFGSTHLEAVGATRCSNNNGLQLGWVSGDAGNVDILIQWSNPASSEKPVILFGSISATLTGGQTSYSLTNHPLTTGIFTIGAALTTYTSDIFSIQVDKLGGGEFQNASVRGLTTPTNALALNVASTVGEYHYNVRNCTTGTNSEFGTSSGELWAVAPATTPEAISFIEVHPTDYPFSYPTLYPDTCSFVVNLTQTTGGTISYKSGYEPTHGGGYFPGEQVIVQYATSSGYTFSNWNVTGTTGDTSVPGEVSFYMPDNDVTVSATFTAIPSKVVQGYRDSIGRLGFYYTDTLGATQFFYDYEPEVPGTFVPYIVCAKSVGSVTFGSNIQLSNINC